MTQTYLYAADLVAISLLTFAVYFPRHRRRDLVVAYLGVNVGVLAVTAALISSDATLGLGLGLLGVLSIIRLRSAELGQHEVAYYFAALALGLLGGLGSLSPLVTLALMATIVVTLYLADHPRLLGGSHEQLMVLDGAYTTRPALLAALERTLGTGVTMRATRVLRVDLANDTTTVEVRFSGAADAAPDLVPAFPHAFAGDVRHRQGSVA